MIMIREDIHSYFTSLKKIVNERYSAWIGIEDAEKLRVAQKEKLFPLPPSSKE